LLVIAAQEVFTMAHSSLLGIDEVPTSAPGHDTEALGPSDTSDSGSDVAGLADLDDGDPGLPVDIATDVDSERPDTSFESIADGGDTDSTGTGERRSAGGDGGLREAADITPDRIVFDPNTEQDAEGALDDVQDDSPNPRGGVDAIRFASSDESSDVAANADSADIDEDDLDEAEDEGERLVSAGGDGDENDEVEPHAPGGTHPKMKRPTVKAHGQHPSRREKDHGLSGPDPDMPAQTPPPTKDPGDEGVNDEGDDVVVVPKA
jgi:hypothetical protein